MLIAFQVLTETVTETYLKQTPTPSIRWQARGACVQGVKGGGRATAQRCELVHCPVPGAQRLGVNESETLVRISQ